MDVTLPGSYPVRDVAGYYSGYADGVGTSARFSSPTGITITPDGATAFVSHTYAIRSVDMKTGAASTLAGSGTQHGYLDGYGPDARFSGSGGLALTPDGSMLLVSDTGNNRLLDTLFPFALFHNVLDVLVPEGG
jgi:sugar lactone lactonase YvrE